MSIRWAYKSMNGMSIFLGEGLGYALIRNSELHRPDRRRQGGASLRERK